MLQIAASRAVYDWGGCHTRSGCGSVMRAEERCVPPQGGTAGSHPFPAFCAEKGGGVPAAVLTEAALSFCACRHSSWRFICFGSRPAQLSLEIVFIL